MQISLDYYRILGVPIQAESHLIQQAYEDRIQQLPHHHYTQYAVTSRKNLVTKAYQILGDEKSRLEYDSSFFHSQEFDDSSSDGFHEVSLSIENSLFIGGLIILLNLGEYELVLRLAKPFLEEKDQAQKLTYNDEDFAQLWQDLILTVVLAHLELAREKWHDQQYDPAANSLRESYGLLEKEELFNSIKKEIKQDLGKLRPYQILELFNKEEPDAEKEQEHKDKAIVLLQEMLDARGGIESQEIDESGLNVDGFLRFVQQIRAYLTSEEQQKLFEIEAQRPSHGAAYLAACACIARGVTQKMPELIIQAKNHLISLTIHQDVYLEQSICALLLGQTAESEFSLTQSQELEVIKYIKEISNDSPDLLPGLCLYTEKWLQTEIFPQFKDLKDKTASLQEYFADTSVQNYLDNLSPPLQRVTEDSSELEFPQENDYITGEEFPVSISVDEQANISSDDLADRIDGDELRSGTPTPAVEQSEEGEFRPSLLMDMEVELISESQPSLTELLGEELEFGNTGNLSPEEIENYNYQESQSTTPSEFENYFNEEILDNSSLEEQVVGEERVNDLDLTPAPAPVTTQGDNTPTPETIVTKEDSLPSTSKNSDQKKKTLLFG